MTLLKLHGRLKAEHFLQLESETQQKENSEPSEAHMELDMMHCYWPWDVETKVQGPDRAHGTHERDCGPFRSNAIAGLTTTSKERTASALQPQRIGLDQQPERAWEWIPQNLPEETHSTFQLHVLQHLRFAPVPKHSRPYGPSTPLNPQHLPECLLHTLTKSSSFLISSFLFLSLVLLSCFNHIPI